MKEGDSCGVVNNVLDCVIGVNKFELQWFSYVHFWTNALGKYLNPLIHSSLG